MPILPKEVFISHSDKDRRFAIRIVKALTKHGVPTWYSRKNIQGAQQWHDEIGAALGRCDWFALILSPEAVNSRWVKKEVVHAILEDRYEDKIVPILYKPCDHLKLSWTLQSIQRIDFTTNFHDGCSELLRIWGLGYKK
jgi:hypothetical protein